MKEKKMVRDKAMIPTSVLDDIKPSSNRDNTEMENMALFLLDERFKRRKTILSDNQVFAITTLDVIAQVYDIPMLKNWVDWFAEWKTSGGGGVGRKDIVDIAKFGYAEKQRMDEGLLDALRGKR